MKDRHTRARETIKAIAEQPHIPSIPAITDDPVRDIKLIYSQISDITDQFSGLILDRFIEIGHILAIQKAEIGRGFNQWVDDNLPFSSRTARRYLQIFQQRENLKLDTRVQNFESLRQVLDFLKSGEPIKEDRKFFAKIKRAYLEWKNGKTESAKDAKAYVVRKLASEKEKLKAIEKKIEELESDNKKLK